MTAPRTPGTGEPGAGAGRLGEVARVFGLLGWRSFGGPVAHVALMRRELVVRRRWVDEAEFARLYAACNLLPGPGSTQLAMLLGRRRAGVLGMVAAAVLFIGPAIVIMLGLGELYLHAGTGRVLQHVLLGVEAAVVGIVARAAVDLGRIAARRVESLFIGGAALALSLAGITPVLLLAGAALLGAAVGTTRRPPRANGVLPHGATGADPGTPTGRTVPRSGRRAILAVGAPLHAATLGTLVPLGLTFLKIGSIAFGSGYVLLSFLHADLVGGRFGLDDRQLGDAFAAGQATPGPVFAIAAFLGVQVAGLAGGVVAGIAIFVPSLLLVPVADVVVRLLERHRAVRAALDGVVAAALGLVAAALVQLARAALTGVPEVLVALAAIGLLARFPRAQPVAVGIGAAAGALIALGTR